MRMCFFFQRVREALDDPKPDFPSGFFLHHLFACIHLSEHGSEEGMDALEQGCL